MNTAAVPKGPSAFGMLKELRGLGPTYLARALAIAAASALVISIPTRLIPNGFFSRMTPTRPQDYVFLMLSSVLLGLVLALRSPLQPIAQRSTIGGGLGTYLAVGCPICNKIVVALLGTGGALTYFAPLQPIIGLGAIVVLWMTLRRRLRAMLLASCPVTG